MRVLHVISGLDAISGGPVAALTGLAESQARVGLDVTIASTWCKGHNLAMAEKLKQCGVKIELIGPAMGRIMSWHREIPRVLKRLVGQMDVVHIHALWEEIQHRAARISQNLEVPYLITPHGMLDPWSLRQCAMKKRLYMLLRMKRNLNRATALHFTTEAERDLAGQMGFRRPAIVEPIGVDMREFQSPPAPGTFRRRYPQLQGRQMILFLGRIHPGKGVEYLIPAMAQLENRKAILVVVGPDSEGFRGKMESLAGQHGVTERVVFTGILRGADRVAALGDADIFALPSEHENFGVVVIESLAAGVPVIVSDQVQLHGEVRRGKVGGVIPLEIGALAKEIDRWLGDKELHRSAAQRAKAFAREHYDWDGIASRWVGHYIRIAATAM